MKEQYRVSSLFKAMVDSYPTIGVAYNGKTMDLQYIPIKRKM